MFLNFENYFSSSKKYTSSRTGTLDQVEYTWYE